jgi:hypothetical protein
MMVGDSAGLSPLSICHPLLGLAFITLLYNNIIAFRLACALVSVYPAILDEYKESVEKTIDNERTKGY